MSTETTGKKTFSKDWTLEDRLRLTILITHMVRDDILANRYGAFGRPNIQSAHELSVAPAETIEQYRNEIEGWVDAFGRDHLFVPVATWKAPGTERRPPAKAVHIDALRAILSRISFRESCVDMQWSWQVASIAQIHGDVTVCDNFSHAGFLIRTSFVRPDTDTGDKRHGHGAWHHVPYGADESSVVKRAWVACEAILGHELREAFMFDGRRVFDPHATVDVLCAASRPS
jgi:hypothetical protein